MKRIASAVIFLIFSCLSGLAQQQAYFLFIQADDSQPFYVQTRGNVYSSSAIGHLIIAGCKDTVYNLVVGFPANRFPQQYFTVSIQKKDHGYLLKNTNGQGWSLENLQTQNVIQAEPVPVQPSDTIYGEKKGNDAFAALMASVVNDTAVLYSSVKPSETINAAVAVVDTPAKQPEVVKNDPPPAVTNTSNNVSIPGLINRPVVSGTATKDTSALVTTDNTTAPTDTQLVKNESKPVENIPVPARATITRLTETDDKDGKRMVFTDATGAAADTIVIIIPFEKEAEILVKKDTPVQKKTVPAPDSAIAVKAEEKKDTQLVVKKDPPKGDTVRVVIEPASAPADAVNKNCRNFATDQDVDKLRVKMLEAVTAYERAEVSRKILKLKCYSSQQIKALSELFANDEGLYRFLEIAYPCVSDPGRFRDLISLLRSEEYVTRFKKMVR
ncbi:MAG: hypothetical protein QM731_15295 [Chitinophagaceae bacterium]